MEKAVRIEAEPREHRNVVGVAMVLIARIAGRLDEGRTGGMFEHPVIAIDVAAFDLMGRGGSPPQEILWKSETLGCHSRSILWQGPAPAPMAGKKIRMFCADSYDCR
jgi:hypothetical protein